MMNHFSSLVPLAVTLIIFSDTPVATANKTLPCDKTGCKEYESCDLSTGKCTLDDGDCLTAPCRYGYYCNDYGKCIKDTPCDLKCPLGEECYLQPVQCFTAPCPPVPSCRLNKCLSIKCPDGEMCENGECVLDSRCALVLCLKGTTCYKGGCFKEIPCEGQCGPVEKCYIGREGCLSPPCPEKVICLPDKCAVVRCRLGFKCVHGQCVPFDDCL